MLQWEGQMVSKRDFGSMKAYGIFLGAILLILAGCRTPPDVTTTFDPISGQRTDLISENMLETSQNPSREVIWLNAARVYRDTWNRRSELYLDVDYMAKAETGYLEIPVGTTLMLTVDGQEMNFTGNGSFNKRKSKQKGFVSEMALYRITQTQLGKIAEAKQVKVRVKGNNGIVEREFRPENFQRFKEFLARVRAS